MSGFPYSVWLVPRDEQREQLGQLIHELSKRFGLPKFAPHLTLCSGEWGGENAALRKAFRRLAVDIEPVELAVDGIDWTGHGSTFFFLRLRGAEHLFEPAAPRIDGSHPPAIGPHLSLLYGLGLTDIDRAALRQELIGRLPSGVRFESLALVHPADGDWKKFGEWSTARTVSL